MCICPRTRRYFYCTASNRNFYQLLKAPSTSVDAHIPVFTSYLQDLNYNSDIPLKDVDVNDFFCHPEAGNALSRSLCV